MMRPARSPGRAKRGLLLAAGMLVLLAGGAAAWALLGPGATLSARPERAAGVPRPAASETLPGAAPDFTLETVDGERFSLSAQRGRIVVFEFLQAGCPSCAQQVPVLDRAASRFAAQGVKVLIIDISGVNDDRQLRAYYRGQFAAGEQLLIAADRGFRVAFAYNLTMAPSAFVVGRDGRIRERNFVPSEQSLVRAIEAALGP